MEDGEIDERMITEESTTAPRPRKMEKSPYDMLKESKYSIEEIVSKILSIKKEGKSKIEIRELLTQMFLNFVTLRQANRTILLEEDRVKAETERAKAPVDFTTLQLHNLMYEKSHYVKAIKACKDFKSKYPDIQLVPDEEFLRDAPGEIKSQTLSDDASHDLMLTRLNYELHQRKELCKLRGRLEQQKKNLLETIANRKKFLSSLPSHLKSLKKASLPVQNQLGFQHTKKLKQHHSAELLPPPLYVLYSQFLAQKEAFEESIDLEIGGSFKEAQAFARQQANKDAGVLANSENFRGEEDVPDEEDDGQRRRKRPNRGLRRDGYDQTGLYQVHPLKIIVYVYDDEASDPKSVKLMSLKFEYFIRLNVVCVGIEGSQDGHETNILCNLFPDDTGLELPHQAAKLIVGDAQAFDTTRTSRPFKWAQHLAGIDILPEFSPSLIGQDIQSGDMAKSDSAISSLALYRQQNRIPTVLQKIRARKKAQMALMEQLDSLMKLALPALNSKDLPWTLHHPMCTLHGWSAVGPSPMQASLALHDNAEQGQEHMEVDTSGSLAPSKEELEGAREDGELPSLVPGASLINDASFTPNRKMDVDHSRQMTMISKSLISPANKGRSPSFRKCDDDLDLVLGIDSDVDETSEIELGVENGLVLVDERAEKFWVDVGAKEFHLTLSRKMKADERSVKLEAKIKITMEYPIRPPLFSLSLHTPEKDFIEGGASDVYNELRAMEAELNLHMIKVIPPDQENSIISHQVRCLAMLFDYFMDGSSAVSKMKKYTSVLDVGLCAPVNGKLVARSVRGRDRRKMISWKDSGCASGYPC